MKVPRGIGIGGVDRKRGEREEKGSFSGTEVWHFITCAVNRRYAQ